MHFGEKKLILSSECIWQQKTVFLVRDAFRWEKKHFELRMHLANKKLFLSQKTSWDKKKDLWIVHKHVYPYL